MLDSIVGFERNRDEAWHVVQCGWQLDRGAAAKAAERLLESRGPDGRAALRIDTQAAPESFRRLAGSSIDYLCEKPGTVIVDLIPNDPRSVDMTHVNAVREMLAALEAASPTCSRKSGFRTASRVADELALAIPIDLSGVREMQLRHADILGRNVRVPGAVAAGTYFNCKYRSSSSWRSFEIATPGEGFTQMWVYCRRGEPYCDNLHERTMSRAESGTFVLRYPTSNRICEESQAELVGIR